MCTRPGLGEFLTSRFRWFDVGVWTSSTEPYARAVVRAIMGERSLATLWCRDRCTRRFDGEAQTHYWVKELQKLKRTDFLLGQILILDDTPQKAERNYGNHIRVSEWQGDETDDELFLLREFLNTLRTISNVRTVEKRGWRAAAEAGRLRATDTL